MGGTKERAHKELFSPYSRLCSRVQPNMVGAMGVQPHKKCCGCCCSLQIGCIIGCSMFILLFGMTIGATFTGRAPDPALAYSFCRDLDLEYRNAYNDCYGTDVCLCDGNEEKEICVFTAFQACAWHASACASHVHRMCIACASHVHPMCIACACACASASACACACACACVCRACACACACARAWAWA